MWSNVQLPVGLHQALIDRESQSLFTVHFRGLLPTHLPIHSLAFFFMLCGLALDLWQDHPQEGAAAALKRDKWSREVWPPTAPEHI